MARHVLAEHFVRMEVFASNLRKRAAELGISNAEAARRSGLSERRYGHYVSGVREPDLATLVRIAQCLGTTPNFLLGVEDTGPVSARQAVIDRIAAAAQALPDADIEIVAIQTEALSAARSKVR